MGNVGTIINAGNQHRVAMAEWERATQTQRSGNKRRAAETTLAEFSRSLRNQVQMENAGKEFNRKVESLAHELEQTGKARINTQLQYAEAEGALAAQAGMVGVGGSSVELMDSLVDLKRASQLDEQMRARELLASRGQAEAAQMVSNAAGAIDLQQTLGSFDYAVHMQPQRMKRRLGKLIGVAVATYFGGPQAGEAVADFAVGEWKASNADYGGANQAFGAGITNAGKAYKQWGERGGQAWGDAVREGWNTGANNNSNVKVTTNSDTANFFGSGDAKSGLGWFSW